MITLGTFRIPFESLIWFGALGILGIWGGDLYGQLTLCPFKLITGHACLGCGLGHSISLALRGDFVGAMWAHPLGIPAVGILVYRSISLLRNSNH